jgi:hypothetical protein
LRYSKSTDRLSSESVAVSRATQSAQATQAAVNVSAPPTSSSPAQLPLAAIVAGALAGAALLIGLGIWQARRARAAASEPVPNVVPEERFCTQCGRQALAGDHFCRGCGATLLAG